MYLQALEDEVEALGAEVTRLRIMLHRVTQVMQVSPLSQHADPLSTPPSTPAAGELGGDKRPHDSQRRQSRHRHRRQQRQQQARSTAHAQSQASSTTPAEDATEASQPHKQKEVLQMPPSVASAQDTQNGTEPMVASREFTQVSLSMPRILGGRGRADNQQQHAPQSTAPSLSSPRSCLATEATHEAVARRDVAATTTAAADAEGAGSREATTTPSSAAAPVALPARAPRVRKTADSATTTTTTMTATTTSTNAGRTTDDAMVSLVRTLREQTAKEEHELEDETSSGVMLDSCLARPASNAVSSATSQPPPAMSSSPSLAPRRVDGGVQPRPAAQRVPRTASSATTSTSGGSTPATGNDVSRSAETSQVARGAAAAGPQLSTSPVPPRAAPEATQRSQSGSKSMLVSSGQRDGESAALARSQSLQGSEGNGCAYSALGLYDMVASTPPTSSLLLRTKSEPSLAPTPGSLPLRQDKMGPPPADVESNSEEESSSNRSSSSSSSSSNRAQSRREDEGGLAASTSDANAQTPPRGLVATLAGVPAGRVPGIRTPQAKGGILERLRAQARSSTSSVASTDDESAVHRHAAQPSSTSRPGKHHHDGAQLAGDSHGSDARAASSPAMTLSAAKQMYGVSLRDSFKSEMAGAELMLESNSNVGSPNQGPHTDDAALARAVAARPEEASGGRSATLEQSPRQSSYGGYDYNIFLDASRSGQSIVPLATSSSAAQLRSTGRLGTMCSHESNDAQAASERYYDF